MLLSQRSTMVCPRSSVQSPGVLSWIQVVSLLVDFGPMMGPPLLKNKANHGTSGSKDEMTPWM